MMAFFLLVAWLFAMPAWGQVGLSPEGTWVSAATRRLAQSGEGGDPGCFLQISEEGWVVEENCSEIPTRWPSVKVTTSPSAVEIRSEGSEEQRRLVLRAGAPAEMELMVERGGEREFFRLYRLDDRFLPALRSLALVRDRLLGAWETEDGVPFRLRADGSYVFGGDLGRFRAEGGFSTEGGAWGALFLEPEAGGPIRRYLLHGSGSRLGLAEVPRDMDLLLPSHLEAEDEEEVVEEVVVEGVAIPLPSRPSEPTAVFPPGAEEPTVGIWLVRSSPTPLDEAQEEEPLAEEEVPAIAQPIRPARKCGCGTAEAGLGVGLLLPALWLARRRI